jgi:hypothetical protein
MEGTNNIVRRARLMRSKINPDPVIGFRAEDERFR